MAVGCLDPLAGSAEAPEAVVALVVTHAMCKQKTHRRSTPHNIGAASLRDRSR